MNRRTLLFGGAGAATLAGLGWRAYDRGVFSHQHDAAFEAWRNWQGKPGDAQATRPLHAAILAASAHNTQPWLFEPNTNAITVYADLSRNLGAADPFRRELFTSIGCAVANLNIAMKDYGVVPAEPWERRRLEPNQAEQPVAALKLNLVKTGTNAILTAMREAIPHRHTNRGPYLPDHALPGLGDIAFPSESGVNLVVVTDATARHELGALIIEATMRFIADADMSADSAKWFRSGRREIERRRDGVTLDGAGLSPVMTALGKMMPDSDAETADAYWLQSTSEVQVPTAAAFGIIFCTDRLQAAQAILTGDRWQRSHLMLAARALAAQPLNQPIEIMDRDHLLGRKNDYAREIRKIAGVPSGDPAFIFRLGHGARPAPPSPRRRLDDVVRVKRYA